MRRLCVTLISALALGALLAPSALGAPEDFGLGSLDVSLSTTEAGAHPDVSFSVEVEQDPTSPPNVFGLHDSYAATRNIRVTLPPGLVGDPNVLGLPQQCTVQELLDYQVQGCPNGSQVGRTTIFAYELNQDFVEPLYMMQPPGGDVVARLGFIAGIFPIYVDIRVRSEDDYAIVSEITDASAEARLIRADTTLWGVPAAPVHDTERCTPAEAFQGCVTSEKRPPGSRPLPFLTNPTRCGVPLAMEVAAASWVEPERFDNESASFPSISGCNSLVFDPKLSITPTSAQAAAPTGLDVTVQLPAAEGVDVLEPSQMRDIRVALPPGLAVNTGSADGLGTCSAEQVGLGTREAAHCPNTAKLASTEFEVAALPRRMKGAVYLREPEPGNPFRIWIVADDLGAHVKLPGQLEVDRSTGQIESIVLDTPQFPVREVSLQFKSGLRAPLVNPPACGTYLTHYEFVPWSGNPPVSGDTPMTIDEGCEGLGGFNPKLLAGATNSSAGQHSSFLFELTREDGEQNIGGFDLSPPRGFVAKFAGVPRCVGAAAQTGACPPESRIGKVLAAVGAGAAPLWVPQPGKRPTAVYLSGPYKGAPLSIVAVVPRQAGPFDFGDEVVRSAITVNPVTAQATAHTDPLPQLIEGIPIRYRTIHVDLDRPQFALNPTSCAAKETTAAVTSPAGALANPSSPFSVTNCSDLEFGPRLSFSLRGGTRRGAHPSLKAVVRPRPGEANIAAAAVTLPRSAFLDQAHIKTVCTRVQFAADNCPAGSVYGSAVAHSPLFDEAFSGPVYLRSSSNPLPDLVVALKGPDTLPIEIELAGRIDSINGGIRSTFSLVPDAPVSSFVLTMQGGQKGLIVNSTNLCAKTQRVTAKLTAQNGIKRTLRPAVKASCGKKRAKGAG